MLPEIKPLLAAGLALALAACSAGTTTEPRKEVSYIRGPYNAAFFRRHGPSEAYSGGFHFHHGREHDVLLQTKLADPAPSTGPTSTTSRPTTSWPASAYPGTRKRSGPTGPCGST